VTDLGVGAFPIRRSVRWVGVSAIACRDPQIRSLASLPRSVMHVMHVIFLHISATLDGVE
jgi:hypothetical protein